MPWQLHHDVSYCRLDDRLIFLDIRKDRYFRLSPALERNFLRFLAGDAGSGADISALARHGLVACVPTGAENVPVQPVIAPARSAVEEQQPTSRIGTTSAAAVLATVVHTRLQLATRPLAAVLLAMRRYRDARARVTSSSEPLTQIDRDVEHAAAVFRIVRPYIPIETRCLIDSISLVRYLASRALHTQLVFGVACDPFSAHCWVQAGKLVLNDTLGSTQAHAPIRVI